MADLLPDAPEPTERQHEYVVVARRYRPQSFEQLVGQNQVSQALGNAINTNRVGHAYLFTGARGVGKTSTARIFSKCLNCLKGPTVTPCGECDVCRSVATGEDVDVIEIDGASNRGIDEIRQLRSNVNVRPSRAHFKIYIIDEVHMLTTQAFNALLKTLEEPPEHVKFIFCTTEADKIPITVLSRCQRFDFSPIETSSIVARLASICESEHVTAEPEALQLLARRAAGSMRDSQSLLEQLLSFGGKNLTVDEVHSMLGTAKGSRLLNLAEMLVQRNAAAALGELDAAVHEGVDVGQLLEQLIGLFRDVMAANVGCTPDLLLHSAPSDAAKLADLGTRLGLETTLAVVQILDHSLVRMRQSTHVRTLAEIALVRICKLEDLDTLSSMIAAVKSGQPLPAVDQKKTADLRQAAGVQPAIANLELGIAKEEVASFHSARDISSASAQPVRSPQSPVPSSAIPNQQSAFSPANPRPVVPAVQPTVAPSPAPSSALDLATVQRVWQQTCEELNDLMAGSAESVAISAPNRLVARFRPQYTLQKETCERAERRSRLTQTLGRNLGRTVILDFELLPDDGQSRSSGPPAPKPVETQAAKRQRMRAIEKHPFVQQAIELFDAEVVQVVEGVRVETEEPRDERTEDTG